MSRTHEQSSSQRDHHGESSQEGAMRRVAPLDVVRQRAQQHQEASQQESQEASQRKAPPSLLELTFSKILEELRPEHVQKDTVGESIVSGIILKKGLADRIFETKEWETWLDKHGMEFLRPQWGQNGLKSMGPAFSRRKKGKLGWISMGWSFLRPQWGQNGLKSMGPAFSRENGKLGWIGMGWSFLRP